MQCPRLIQINKIVEPMKPLIVLPTKERRAARPLTGREAAMYKAYFLKRLLEAISLAEQADSAEERCVHLRASRHYRDLIDSTHRRNSI